MPRLALCLVALCACPAAFAAAPPAPAEPDLAFTDIHYLTRTLDDLPKSKAYVLAFTTTSCPLVGRYLPVINRLEKDYRDKGVQLLALNVGAEDSIAAMATQAVEYEAAFPFVKDTGGRCAAKLGVTRTPEVVVLDAKRAIRYRGRIDDQYRIGGAKPKPTRHDLREAIDEVLAGKKVSVPETPVDGCLITRTDLPKPSGKVTFADHVAPIIRKHCGECHRPDTSAPFSLLTYDQVAGKADTIAEVVRDGRMPPWYAAPSHTEFTNKRGLSAKERETLLQWVKHGRERGDDSKLEKPAERAKDGWLIGKPDLIIRAEEHEIPAEGVVDYKYVVLLRPFLLDTWIQGAQILPDNPRVLHHCSLVYATLGEKCDIKNLITAALPGGGAMALEKGVAYKIPACSVLGLQIHYVTTGKKEKCRISVGLKYAEGKVDQHLRFECLVDREFTIPAFAPAHRVAASRTLERDADGVCLFTHMHVRGRDMTYLAHYPDGKTETLLMIPNYNFDWQTAYRWEPGKKKFPKGTRLEAVAHYDNSAFNPFNPDPKAAVRYGEQTYHEMMYGFVFYTETDEKLGLDIDGKTGRPKK